MAARPFKPDRKETFTVRLDPDILAALAPFGRKRSSIVNSALRQFLNLPEQKRSEK